MPNELVFSYSLFLPVLHFYWPFCFGIRIIATATKYNLNLTFANPKLFKAEEKLAIHVGFDLNYLCFVTLKMLPTLHLRCFTNLGKVPRDCVSVLPNKYLERVVVELKWLHNLYNLE